MVVICLIRKVLHKICHIAEVNWTPLSDVITSGTPKRAIHPLVRAAAQSVAVVFFNSTASGHLVVLSTMVKR